MIAAMIVDEKISLASAGSKPFSPRLIATRRTFAGSAASTVRLADSTMNTTAPAARRRARRAFMFLPVGTFR